MSYQVLFTVTAKQDLREIALNIADISKNTDIAVNFVNEMQKKCDQLIDFPESGALPNDRVLRSLGYRFLIYKDYLMFYTVDQESETVYIQAVFNAKRDYIRVLKKML